VVQEVLTGEGRSYLKIQEDQYNFWVSVPQLEVEPGQLVLLGKGPLKYAVPGAGRIFDALTVIEEVAVVELSVAEKASRLPVVEGGMDIATLYTRRKELQGQEVKLRGRVVKMSRNIEGTNWYHLQDGSQSKGGENDLTFTSDQLLEVGMVVVIQGALTLDKDLGFGYFYSAILEKPVVTVER
jgi:hypothetical protein